MNATARSRIIVPLDVSSASEALAIVRRLTGQVGMFKVGLQLFCAEGPDIVQRVADEGGRVFLDLKLHDIPNTVAHAAAEAVRPGVAMMDVHLSGGEAMLRSTVESVATAAGARGVQRPLLLGITVLTSLDRRDLEAAGVTREIETQVVELARLGQRAGLDGVVASPHEIAAIKAACGREFLVVTPGIRPAGAVAQDQKRFMTPGRAIASGADYLVIGRPILDAPDPSAAVEGILKDIQA